MTKAKWQAILADVNAELTKVAAKHGLEYQVGRFQFTDNQLWGKTTFITPAGKDKNNGKRFTFKGREYIFIRTCPNRPKYPYLATGVKDGKTYKLPLSAKADIQAGV